MMDLVDLTKVENPHEKEVLAEFDRRRKARNLTLPTDDVQVKLMLRRCDQPICNSFFFLNIKSQKHFV